MKTKPMIFALGICLLLLSGCVASVGPEYGYYPPVQPYYGYGRAYYPRPVVVRPYYRPPYRSGYHGEGGPRGGGNWGGNHGGSYHGRSH